MSNANMLQLIDGIPSLKNNHNKTEYIISTYACNGSIILDKPPRSETSDPVSAVQVQFSYDFVQDRWFLNDKRITVFDLQDR